jgi:hypothetical protein
MLPIVQYWPVLAVLALGVAGLGVLVFFFGRRRPFEIAVYLAANLVLGALVYDLLEESGLTGLLAGRYDEGSLAAFTELCVGGCARHGNNTEVCRRYCACMIERGQRTLSYDEMLAKFTGRGSDSVETRWRRMARICAIRLVDR